MSRDEVMAALDDLVEVLCERSPGDMVAARTAAIREYRAAGGRYSDIVENEFRPLVVEMISAHIQDLVAAAGRLRRAQAAALHAEGMTMDQIAAKFGVTRQRISQLLNDA